ncbi:hypothetical protein V1477_004013 [Vespula maculifrons]|uniref:Uncharacterized protein n=1 Tax=Vespula maculifrons TaxID=7453 RepID=A0ABD2CQE2_VESMC
MYAPNEISSIERQKDHEWYRSGHSYCRFIEIQARTLISIVNLPPNSSFIEEFRDDDSACHGQKMALTVPIVRVSLLDGNHEKVVGLLPSGGDRRRSKTGDGKIRY